MRTALCVSFVTIFDLNINNTAKMAKPMPKVVLRIMICLKMLKRRPRLIVDKKVDSDHLMGINYCLIALLAYQGVILTQLAKVASKINTF